MLLILLLILVLQGIILLRIVLSHKEAEKPLKELKKKIKVIVDEPNGSVLTEADFKKYLTKKKILEKNQNGEEITLDDVL